MQLIYTHPNILIVGHVRAYLESHGIKTTLKNEILAGAAGELAPIDLWLEVWVERESDIERAKKLIKKLNSTDNNEWHCKHCGENNASSFELCWKCNKDNFSNYDY